MAVAVCSVSHQADSGISSVSARGLMDPRLAFGIALVVALLLSGWSRAGARASAGRRAVPVPRPRCGGGGV
ncbi:hypothetical protein [Streptomyces scopuliridis]|uniref:hypothetical protein n=1 Tax=Streptomyces scopuliridis TaxID=452529 RepID=UPI0004BEC56E|nr:hypothetical protein [Streptomyces scopuliridis]